MDELGKVWYNRFLIGIMVEGLDVGFDTNGGRSVTGWWLLTMSMILNHSSFLFDSSSTLRNESSLLIWFDLSSSEENMVAWIWLACSRISSLIFSVSNDLKYCSLTNRVAKLVDIISIKTMNVILQFSDNIFDVVLSRAE